MPATQADAAGAPLARPSAAALLAEGEKLRTTKPDDWARWDAAVADVLAKHAAMVKDWAMHSPPPPNVAHLDLPLGYLVWQWKKATEDSPATHKAAIGLRAIADSRDVRRIDVLLEALGASDFGGGLPVKAMTPEGVERAVRQLLAGEPKLGRDAPLQALLGAFADRLSPATRKAGYDWLCAAWPPGPSNGEGMTYWRTLFRLDVERARGDVIPYHGQSYLGGRVSYNLGVLMLLLENAGPSEQVAKAVRQRTSRPRRSSPAGWPRKIGTPRAI